MPSNYASAAERIAVGASAPHGEFAAVSTSFRVRRWDEEQTAWALRKYARDHGGTPARADWALTPADFGRYGVSPYSDTREDNCNMIVQAGWVALLGSIAGTSITNKFSGTYGRIGVGTSNTAAAYTQTYLQGDTGGGSTTSYYQLVSGAPTISTGSTPPTLVFSASFASGNANFAWQEFGTDNYTASSVTTQGTSSVFFNRGVSNQGTKASGQTWTATETISFGYPSGSGTVS